MPSHIALMAKLFCSINFPRLGHQCVQSKPCGFGQGPLSSKIQNLLLAQLFYQAWTRHCDTLKRASTAPAGMWFVEEYLPSYAMASAALEMYRLPGASDNAQVDFSCSQEAEQT